MVTQVLEVPEHFVVALPMNQEVEIDGCGVTLIGALVVSFKDSTGFPFLCAKSTLSFNGFNLAGSVDRLGGLMPLSLPMQLQ
jgi:hypothetical protein